MHFLMLLMTVYFGSWSLFYWVCYKDFPSNEKSSIFDAIFWITCCPCLQVCPFILYENQNDVLKHTKLPQTKTIKFQIIYFYGRLNKIPPLFTLIANKPPSPPPKKKTYKTNKIRNEKAPRMKISSWKRKVDNKVRKWKTKKNFEEI